MGDSLKTYIVDIALSARQIEAFYAGSVAFVWSRDVTGVGVQFPINALRPFVEHDGVRGRFHLVTDQEHRLRRVERVSRY